jgi:hypothetical protein
MPISSGRTQTSSMSIISSSPLREGILSQAQDFVRLITSIQNKDVYLFFSLGFNISSAIQPSD